MSSGVFLPGLPADLIEAAYRAAPGNEIDSGGTAPTPSPISTRLSWSSTPWAFGPRCSRRVPHAGKRAVLFYLYAEPEAGPGGARRIADAQHQAHQAEIARFAP